VRDVRDRRARLLLRLWMGGLRLVAELLKVFVLSQVEERGPGGGRVGRRERSSGPRATFVLFCEDLGLWKCLSFSFSRVLFAASSRSCSPSSSSRSIKGPRLLHLPRLGCACYLHFHLLLLLHQHTSRQPRPPSHLNSHTTNNHLLHCDALFRCPHIQGTGEQELGSDAKTRSVCFGVRY